MAQFPTKMAELGVDALVKAIRGEQVELLIDSGSRAGDQRQHGRVPVGQGGAGRRVGPCHPIAPNSCAMDRSRGIDVQFVETLVCSEPGRLHLEWPPAPRPAEGQGRVRPLQAGICGTDFQSSRASTPFLDYPRVMGHELAVEIVDAPDASVLAPGEVCVVNPYLSCGQCVACRNGKPNCCARISVLGVHQDGGMAELLSLPAANLIQRPASPPDQCATVELLAIGAHAVRRGAVSARDRVLVVGAGPIGLGVALFARHSGARSSSSTGRPTARRARARSPAWTRSRPMQAHWTPGFPMVQASTSCSTPRVARRPCKVASTMSRTAEARCWSAWSRSRSPSWTLTSTGRRCPSSEAETQRPRTFNASSPPTATVRSRLID